MIKTRSKATYPQPGDNEDWRLSSPPTRLAMATGASFSLGRTASTRVTKADIRRVANELSNDTNAPWAVIETESAATNDGRDRPIKAA